MPGKHSAKQKRQAKHVAASERKRGMDPKRAESIGWATVNARKGGDVIEDFGAAPSPPKKLPTMNIAETDAKPVEHISAPTPTPYSVTRAGMDSAMKATGSKSKKKIKKAGESAQTPRPARTQNRLKISDHVNAKTSNDAVDRIFHGKKQPVQKLGMTSMRLNAAQRAAKSFVMMSIDEAYGVLKAEGGTQAPKLAATPGAPPTGAPKKFPRGDKPTIKMKPISDQEAMANLKAGKHYEKAMRRAARKALQTGYGKTSGGGALKAPNRGANTMRSRPSDLSLSIFDLNRSMEAMPKPSGAVKPPTYLPGVHDPKSPMRPGLKRRTGSTSKKSERPTVVNKKSPRPLDGGGATMLSNSIKNVVHKSGGAAPMSKLNFNDLFKSELGIPADEVLVNCPHCEAPITKSDLSKASGHKGKGAAAHTSGSPTAGHGSAHVRDQNPDGGTMRGGDGKGVITPSRGVPGAKKTDDVVGVQNSKGSRKVSKAEADSSSDSSSDDDDADDKPFEKNKEVKKSINKPITVRGTEWVQYVDDGTDEFIAKSIAEGMGGTLPTQPLDLNNDLTRLLI